MSTPLQNLLGQARQHLAQGQVAQSILLYEAVLQKDQANVEASNALAMVAMGQGQGTRATQLLNDVLERWPQDLLTLGNLVQVHGLAGNDAEALRVARQVLALRPGHYVARLRAAQALERAGRAEQALPQYFRALIDAQAEGRWTSAETTPAPLRPLVEHAMRFVNRGRAELYDRIMAPLRQRYGMQEMARVDTCVAVYLGDRRADPPTGTQQPRFLYFPDLPSTPFLDTALVPELAALEAQTAVIQGELDAVLEQPAGQEQVFHNPALAAANLRGSRGAPSWTGFYFHRHGQVRAANAAACPQTFAALERLPLCRVREHGPETLFSVLTPGTHLLPHRGVTNTRVVGHLALRIPPDCVLRVAEIEHRWIEGRTVLFDDTYLHEAWNRSDRTRVVLIFDLWNPHLTPAERHALAELVAAIGDFRVAADMNRSEPDQ